MEKNKITEVINRYLTSKNVDYKKDYEAIKSFMVTVENNNKNNSLFNELELEELKEKIALRYLNLLHIYRQIPDKNTPTANMREWKKGYAMLIQMEKATTPSDREYYLREFETLLYNANLDTKVVLLSIKEDSDRRMKMVTSLDGDDGEGNTITNINDLEYINSALAALQDCKTVEELAEKYWELSPQVAQNINNDLNFESRREKEITYGSYSSTYRSMLTMLEKQQDEHYNVLSPKYCLNNELPQLLMKIITNHNNNGNVAPSVREDIQQFAHDIDYRYKVGRTLTKDYERMTKDYEVIYYLAIGEAPITTVNAAIAKLKW